MLQSQPMNTMYITVTVFTSPVVIYLLPPFPDSDLEDTPPPELDGTLTEHPARIVLRRAGYYTIPSLDELARMVAPDGSCVVDNFAIGRLNYGNVYYPDSFDIAGLNLDEIGKLIVPILKSLTAGLKSVRVYSSDKL